LDGFPDSPPDKKDQKEIEKGKGKDENSADKHILERENEKPEEEGTDENGFEDHPGFLPKAQAWPKSVKFEQIEDKGPYGNDGEKEVQIPRER